MKPFLLLYLFFTTIAGAYSQSYKEGIYSFFNGKNKLTVAIMPKDSSTCYMWAIVDSVFHWEAQPLYFKNNIEFYYYSGGENNRANSTCVVEGRFARDYIELSYFDTMCFLNKFKLQPIKLQRVYSKIDNEIFIREVYFNRDIHTIVNKTALYLNDNYNYYKLDTIILSGTKVLSNFKDHNGYRYIKFIDSNGHFVGGNIKDSDITPLPKVMGQH